MRGTGVSKDDVAEVRKLRTEGLSVREISRKLGISYQQAYSRAGLRKAKKARAPKRLTLRVTGSPVTSAGTLAITTATEPGAENVTLTTRPKWAMTRRVVAGLPNVSLAVKRTRIRPAKAANGTREAALVAFGVQMGLDRLAIALRALESART